jgi:hypothetical protein
MQKGPFFPLALETRGYLHARARLLLCKIARLQAEFNSNTLTTAAGLPKRRHPHGVARPVADCMTRNLSCTACVCPLTTLNVETLKLLGAQKGPRCLRMRFRCANTRISYFVLCTSVTTTRPSYIVTISISVRW